VTGEGCAFRKRGMAASGRRFSPALRPFLVDTGKSPDDGHPAHQAHNDDCEPRDLPHASCDLVLQEGLVQLREIARLWFKGHIKLASLIRCIVNICIVTVQLIQCELRYSKPWA
jgi:hypothetical protein